jgi:hypothetical protein
MRFYLRVLYGTSLLAVAFFSATAYADVIPYSLPEAVSISASANQTAGPLLSYSGPSIHNQATSYVEAEDFLVPFDEDYQYDAVAYNKAVATQKNPKPGNFVLLGSGLLTVAGLVRRRKGV